jgi:hypothetical protein
MEKVNGHHFLFYLPAIIYFFYNSHPENAREKEKGSALLMRGEIIRVLIEYGLKVCIFTEINDLFSTGRILLKASLPEQCYF